MQSMLRLSGSGQRSRITYHKLCMPGEFAHDMRYMANVCYMASVHDMRYMANVCYMASVHDMLFMASFTTWQRCMTCATWQVYATWQECMTCAIWQVCLLEPCLPCLQVRTLVEDGEARIDMEDQFKRTPIQDAESAGHLHVATYLKAALKQSHQYCSSPLPVMERLPEIGKQFAPAPLQLMSILQTFSCSLAPNECICCSHSQTRRDSTLLVPEMERLTDTGMFAPVPMPIKPMNILPKRPISAASNRSSTSARRRALRAASP
eukprot:scaffold96657_cov23-Tisochrysis_lutea.AAC.1